MKRLLSRSGFTLVEVNLAIFIMAVGVLSMCALYGLGYRENRQSEEDVYATASADAVWCDFGMMETIFSGGANPSTNCLMSAFYNLSRSDYEPTWKVGDAYGFEVGEIQLPHGFIFGQTPPSSVGRIQLVKTILFDPDDNSDKSVEICSTKPNASGMPVKFKAAGKASTGENVKL